MGNLEASEDFCKLSFYYEGVPQIGFRVFVGTPEKGTPYSGKPQTQKPFKTALKGTPSLWKPRKISETTSAAS